MSAREAESGASAVPAERRRGVLARTPLHVRLLLGMAAPLVCLVATGLAVLVAFETADQRRDLRDSLRSTVVALTNEFHRIGLLRDQGAAVETSERLRHFGTIERLWVLDEMGVPVYAYARPGLIATAPPSPSERADPRWLAVPLSTGGQQLGLAIVEPSLDELRARLAARLSAAGAISGVMLLAALVGALLLGRAIARPIRRISSALAETARTLDTGRPLEAHGGPETRALAGSVNRLLAEITSQREQLERTNARIEAEVEERTRQLKASERRIRALATHAPVGIFEADASGACVFINRAWTDITGLMPDEALGRPWTDALHADDRAPAAERWMQTADAGEFAAECRAAAPDGRIAWVCASAVALREDSGRIIGYLGTITDITERKRMEDELRVGAFYDRLTGLPNRASIRERLAEAIERAAAEPSFRYAAMYLDFDRFKLINDTMGHGAGDALLVCIAERLRGAAAAHARPGLAIAPARLGGDEFVVLLGGVDDEAEALAVAAAFCERLAAPHLIEGNEVVSTASIGVVLGPADYSSPDEVLRDADAAMYRRKTAGRRGVALFDATMRDQAVARNRLEQELRGALDRAELTLHYQPIVCLDTRRPVGFEALLRWNHPTRGVLAPAQFIPIAEESGLIVPIGRWVLGEACRQARLWRSWTVEPDPLYVSVNLARRHVEDRCLLADVAHALDATGLNARSLVIEVTESTIMHDVGTAVAALSTLRARGVRIAMDDFGTGHSSLSCLRQLPLDILKIDRSFISGLTADRKPMAILSAIVDLASHLGFTVVAEGIESADEAAPLIAMDCSMAQGYFFSRPLPPEEIPAWCVRAAAPRVHAA
ncbi:MAG TPA: EAL domain-containing protein [Phycisphaerales bacterium]|nr:EAL domain-containing protein [Phycisphaerales bacterium]